MAIALKEHRPVRGVEAVAERPDGTRVPFIPFPTPLRNSDGEVVAGSLSHAVQTRDLWTFRRAVNSRGPNWLLTETDEEE